MYDIDREPFANLMKELCVSVNRPFTADLLKVFWDDLNAIPFQMIERQAKTIRASGKKAFTSHDLRPPPEERHTIGGPDNNALLAQLCNAMNRIYDRLTLNQRAVANYHEFIWTRDRIAPRPVALVIKADGDAPGHRITLTDCALDEFDDRPPPTQPHSEWNEADAVRDVLKR